MCARADTSMSKIESPHPDGKITREIVRVNCLKHEYEDHTQVNLCGMDLVIHEGERVAILGANGSGKTTLLFHLVGLLRPLEGEVTVFEVEPWHDFAKIRERVGVVLQ